MDLTRFIWIERSVAFAVICAFVFAVGMTPGELVWGLLISSTVSGFLALMLPLWVLLLFPDLDRKFFPDHEPPDFTPVGRFGACIGVTAIFAGPFLMFMLGFVAWLIETLPLPGMPVGWFAAQAWAIREFWPIVLMVTALALYESVVQLLALKPDAFFRPYALILKMLAIVVISNFGFGWWSIFPIVAILQFPEDFIIHRISN